MNSTEAAPDSLREGEQSSLEGTIPHFAETDGSIQIWEGVAESREGEAG